jgi:transcriptional regulator with XRE-family HTH domain
MTIDQQSTSLDYIGKPAPLGALLRRLRQAEHAALTTADVALQLGRDRAWVEAVEAGKIEPTLNDLHNLGHVYGVAVQISFRPFEQVREVPHFASLEEEADWWCTHQLADDIWEQADEGGTDDVGVAPIDPSRR